MGTRGGRAREGGLERSWEAHAGVEESGKGMYSRLVVHIYMRVCENYDINNILQEI